MRVEMRITRTGRYAFPENFSRAIVCRVWVERTSLAAP
jgi:hypothetical protein